MILFGLHRWRGETGHKYWFNITLTDNGIPDDGGLYVFVRRRFVFFLKPLYFGKATNFQDRLIGHERWGEAWWLRGATERHVKIIKDPRERARFEEDLIRGLKPVMNDQLVPRDASDAPVNKKLRKAWHKRNWWFGQPRTS
ncbi:MAG: GIY-YIG nuclease family protein [Pseudomonadota bacterium]